MPVAPSPASSLPGPRPSRSMTWRKPVPTYHPPQPILPPMTLSDHRSYPDDVPRSPTGSVDVTLQPEPEEGGEDDESKGQAVSTRDGVRRNPSPQQPTADEHWEEVMQKIREYSIQVENALPRRPSSPSSLPVYATRDSSVTRRPSEPSALLRRPSASTHPPQPILVAVEASPTIVVTHGPRSVSPGRSSSRSVRKASSAKAYRPPTPPRQFARPPVLECPVSPCTQVPVPQSPYLDESSDIMMHEVSRKPSVLAATSAASMTVTARPSCNSLNSANTTAASQNTDSWYLPAHLQKHWPHLRDENEARRIFEERMRALPHQTGLPPKWIDVPKPAFRNAPSGAFNPMHVVAVDRLRRPKRRGCCQASWDALTGTARFVASCFRWKATTPLDESNNV
ncbi:hypothetical protein K488DRAFT_81805 [Vararia minispora EC-137]|uniref:Uncharacterized protein n=1 Tax=Vararia minispora EC-137 TaxID=1314806 RepID=A0ACB8QZ31_9AGAM|nr:hypothetical protein K488DRAFT_81805 [Vararia minispora EC-137]